MDWAWQVFTSAVSRAKSFSCNFTLSVNFAMARLLQINRVAIERSHQLRQFVLNGVVSTEKTLGTGSYGSVLEV